MLILPHADRFWIYLHKFCERVLQTSCYRHRRTLRHVEIREFLLRQLGSRIHARARLADHHVRNAFGVHFFKQFGGKGLGLVRGGAVADSYAGHAVFPDERFDFLFGFGDLVVRRHGVDNARVEHFAGAVYNGDLASGAVARVEPYGHGVVNGRLHEQMAGVFGKHFDRVRARFIGQFVAYLALYRREYQPVVSVVGGFEHQLTRFAVVSDVDRSEYAHGHGAVEFHVDFQKFLFLAAVHREHAVPGDFVQPFALVGVHPVHAQILFGAFRMYKAVLHADVAYALSALGVVGNCLGYYVERALKRVLGGRHAFFFVNIFRGFFKHARSLFVLSVNEFGKRFEPFFFGDRSARAPLGAERTVDVFYLRQRFGGVERGGYLVGHFFLLGDRSAHFFALFVERAEIRQPFAQVPELFVVERAGHFFAVTRYERHRVAFVEQLYRRFGLALSYMQFGCEFCDNIHFAVFSVLFLFLFLFQYHRAYRAYADDPRRYQRGHEPRSAGSGIALRRAFNAARGL